MKDDLIKLLSAGRFPNNKNRVWTMCNVVLKLATQCMEEAEKYNLTDEQFYLAWETALSILSTKDHTNNKQIEDFNNEVKCFMADSE